ncbi:hypothetical protein IIF17_004307 [Salmonella enterica]|jgi:DNA-directed RNA polymerase specialized sigma24 family protein|nr:hypothetical protein [Salmonella enterica]
MSKKKADRQQMIDAVSKVMRQPPKVIEIGEMPDTPENREAMKEWGLYGAEMPPQRRRLVELMKSHNLTAKATGELLGRSERTVLIWRCHGGKEIPASMLELLELKLSKGDV